MIGWAMLGIGLVILYGTYFLTESMIAKALGTEAGAAQHAKNIAEGKGPYFGIIPLWFSLINVAGFCCFVGGTGLLIYQHWFR